MNESKEFPGLRKFSPTSYKLQIKKKVVEHGIVRK